MVRFFMPERGNAMDETITFEYFYGGQSDTFSFYRIPRLLVTGAQFKCLSTDSKLLYGLLLDRMGLSAKNGWYDKQGRVFIYYALDEIQTDLNCGHEKAVKLLAELDAGKGIGLIERVKQGQGRPSKIYVKQFTARAIPSQPPTPQDIPRLPIFGSQEVGKSEVKTSEKQKSRLPVFGSADFGKSDANYNNIIYTENIYTDPSIHPSDPALPGWIDRRECRADVKDGIEYQQLCSQYAREDVNEIVDLMTDILASTRPTLRIGGEELPIAAVKERFWRLEQSHIEYVMESLRNNTTQVRNIRGYLLTALYNAPATIGHSYQAAVQHDLYGQ